MYGIIVGEIILGVALMILLFAPYVTAEMSSDLLSKSPSELQSDRSTTPTQPRAKWTLRTPRANPAISRPATRSCLSREDKK